MKLKARRKTAFQKQLGLNNPWGDVLHFTMFLTETLIPDLKESGRPETAADFEDAVTIINKLTATPPAPQFLVEDSKEVSTWVCAPCLAARLEKNIATVISGTSNRPNGSCEDCNG